MLSGVKYRSAGSDDEDNRSEKSYRGSDESGEEGDGAVEDDQENGDESREAGDTPGEADEGDADDGDDTEVYDNKCTCERVPAESLSPQERRLKSARIRRTGKCWKEVYAVKWNVCS